MPQSSLTPAISKICYGYMIVCVASGATATVGIVCRDISGSVGGIVALLGIIVLPITSGDTALRSLRLTIAESFHIDQSTNAKRLSLSAVIFALVAVILVFAKINPQRFQHSVALLRLVQPDAVPVRFPRNLRPDV